jgi:hypothetical protein
VKSQRGNLDIGVFFVLFMRCILNFGVKWLMEKVSSNILDVAVLSQLVVLNRYLLLRKINGLKISIDFGFIIKFLWSKRRMKLTELLEDILWLQGCTRTVLIVNLNFKVQEVLNLVRSFINLLQVYKVLEIFTKSILLLGFGL